MPGEWFSLDRLLDDQEIKVKLEKFKEEEKKLIVACYGQEVDICSEPRLGLPALEF